jgi:F-type H+-transporting ATPase subunit gamma
MKMVSSIKSKRSQKQAEAARPYNKKIFDILRLLVASDSTLTAEHKFINPQNSNVKNIVIIVVAGDKGMCGSFNSNLFKAVDLYLNTTFKKKYPDAIPHILTIGTKSTEHYKKQKQSIKGTFPNVFQRLDFSIINDIRSLFIDDYNMGNIDRVEVFYNRFVNVMKQEPTKLQLLPIEFDIKKEDIIQNNLNYIFEPDKKTIFETLLNQYLDLNIWKPMLESNAAEQAARLIAMDKATQNAKDLIRELELQYNNARQAAITTEMLEIVGGAEALSK